MPTETRRVKLKINDPRDDRLIPGIQGKIVATGTDDIDRILVKWDYIEQSFSYTISSQDIEAIC